MSDAPFALSLPTLDTTSLRLASGPLVLEVGRASLQQVQGTASLVDGKLQLRALQAASADLSAVRLHGPLPETPPGAWSLAPLGAAEGAIRARITDAHLLFDADVTVPVRQGRIHFSDASVAHVGPDSRMGVSRLGLYVDAPNGRSYLYQFASTPVAGVTFEKRGALIGPWVTDRGELQLQPFAESLLRQAVGAAAAGFTAQARQLLARTSISGEVRLADGPVSGPGLQARLVEHAQGRNTVRVRSDAVDRGVQLEVPQFALRDVALAFAQAHADEVTGALTLRLSPEGNAWHFALEAASLRVGGLRWQAPTPANTAPA